MILDYLRKIFGGPAQAAVNDVHSAMANIADAEAQVQAAVNTAEQIALDAKASLQNAIGALSATIAGHQADVKTVDTHLTAIRSKQALS